MKTKNKGKNMICGQSPVGQGLPERTGLFKKGYRQVVIIEVAACKDNTGNIGSSSENDNNPENNAWNVNFNNGNVDWNNKNNGNYVRGVFAFWVQPNAQTK